RRVATGKAARRYAARPAVVRITTMRFIRLGPAPSRPRSPAVPNSSRLPNRSRSPSSSSASRSARTSRRVTGSGSSSAQARANARSSSLVTPDLLPTRPRAAGRSGAYSRSLHDLRAEPGQALPGPLAKARPPLRDPLGGSSKIYRRTRGGRHLVRNRGGGAGRLPRPQRGGEDHDAQDARRPAASHLGFGHGGRPHPLSARARFPSVHHARDRPEAAAPLGPPAGGDLRAQPRRLRDPGRRVPPHARRARRAARARGSFAQADPPALARRTHEVRA